MKNIVRLKILSEDIAPAEISTRLGIVPTRSWQKGDADRKKVSLNMAKWNGWILDSECVPTLPLDEQVEVLLRKIEPHKREIYDISSASDVTISLVSYSNPDKSFFLPKHLIAAVAACGASLDFDVYDIDE